MKPRLQFHRIPIYDVRLWVGVADNPLVLEKKLSWAFGSPQEESSPGLCCYHRSKFGLLFDNANVSHAIIAHEVMHATHRIMDYVSARFAVNQSEPYAYLCGYLTEIVYGDLVKWRVQIQLKAKQVPVRFVLP